MVGIIDKIMEENHSHASQIGENEYVFHDVNNNQLTASPPLPAFPAAFLRLPMRASTLRTNRYLLLTIPGGSLFFYK